MMKVSYIMDVLAQAITKYYRLGGLNHRDLLQF